MTLSELLSLCRAYRDIDLPSVECLTDVAAGFKGSHATNDLQNAMTWLLSVEAFSGNDEELADEIGGAIQMMRAAVRRAESEQ